jgi:hypothetical protein
MSSAELTVWARVEGLDGQAVQRALWQDRTLVKTWAMRGTLHLLPARELPLWHGALSTSRRYLSPALWKRNFGITLEELDCLTEAVGIVLKDRIMTREELLEDAARRMGSAALAPRLAKSGWGTVLKPAAFSGRLCFAPSVGNRVRFTRPDSWLGGPSAPVDPRSIPSAVTRRFLEAYAPATHKDLARWWGGGSLVKAREWMASLGEEVSPVEVEGSEAWMLTTHARKLREFRPKPSVRLLPAFDQYVVEASPHAGHLLPGDWRRRIYRPQGWISPVLLVNGHMQGTWRHEIRGSRLELVIEPFVKPLPWVRRAAAREAVRLAAFFGCTLSLSFKR